MNSNTGLATCVESQFTIDARRGLSLLLIVVGMLLSAGCDEVSALSNPRPMHAERWLIGQDIKYESGLLMDSYWRVEEGEISELKYEKISKDPNGSYAATISFNAIRSNGKGLAIRCILRYEAVPGTDNKQSSYKDFTVLDVQKIGTW